MSLGVHRTLALMGLISSLDRLGRVLCWVLAGGADGNATPKYSYNVQL